MKHWWLAIASLAVGSTLAAAQGGERPAVPADSAARAARCMQGVDFAGKQDLPRASLYLESCDIDAFDADTQRTVARTKAAVGHKLDASKLSAMSIVTTPEGLVGETDAMPGERFTTPATIWAKAGDYKVNLAIDAATLDAGKGLTTTATLDAFSRRTVLLDVPIKKSTPKDGKVDFTDDPNEQAAHTGPPPKVKHGTMLPKKYLRPGAPSGPQLDDPFAQRDDGSLAWHLGARVGGGIYLRDASDTGAALSVGALAMRSLAGPVALTARAGWSHRQIDAIGLEAGVAFRLAGKSSFVLSAGAALRGEIRVQDHLAMEPVARVGVGAAAGLDLSLLSVPLVVGLRAEPSFTELVPGVRVHGLLLEVGYDWR